MNVVFVCFDSLRKDFVVSSIFPKTWDWFRNATDIDARSPSTWTPTVFASMFSGRSPLEHKVFRNVGQELEAPYYGKNDALIDFSRRKKTFFTTNPWMRFNFMTNGFDEVNIDFSGVGTSEDMKIKILKCLHSMSGDDLVFIHLMDTHYPYRQCSIATSDVKESALERWRKINVGKTPVDDFFACVDAVSYADSLFECFLNDATDDTVFFFFGDHGDDLGDMAISTVRHGTCLRGFLTRIPFFTNAKVKIDNIMSLTDILKVAGMIVDGKKTIHVSPVIEGAVGLGVFSYYVLCDNCIKFIGDLTGIKEVYNIKSDPLEHTNLLKNVEQIVSKIVRISFGQGYNVVPATPCKEDSEAMIKKLRGLGYL
jgi:hypothetical protein